MTDFNRLPQSEFFGLLEETLCAGGEALFTPSGDSMWPMLTSDRDTVILRAPNGSLQKYDLPLYQRKNGQYVLHRVVGKDAQGYIMRGDHQCAKEYGIRDEQIVGIVVAFVRNGKRYEVNDWRYRLYCRLWTWGGTVWLRRCRGTLKRLMGGKQNAKS